MSEKLYGGYITSVQDVREAKLESAKQAGQCVEHVMLEDDMFLVEGNTVGWKMRIYRNEAENGGGESKTSAEIARALRCTATVQTGDEPCASCPFNRTETLSEEQKAQLHCEEWHSCDVDGVALAAADLIERLEKEKAALLEYAKKSAGCDQCKNDDPQCDAGSCIACKKECACGRCIKGSRWEWKGLAPKEPEVDL